jgi:hypothetical protein
MSISNGEAGEEVEVGADNEQRYTTEEEGRRVRR